MIISEKIWDVIARDLWIVLLDILAVNAACFLALQVALHVSRGIHTEINEDFVNAQGLCGLWPRQADHTDGRFFHDLNVLLFHAM